MSSTMSLVNSIVCANVLQLTTAEKKCRSCAVWAGLLHVRVWSTPRPRAFVCGTFMADATGQDRTESRSRYDWLRAGTSEL